MKSVFLPLTVLLAIPAQLFGQCSSVLNLQTQWQEPYPVNISAMSVEPDQLGRPYIYVASNELGLRIYNVAGAPVFSATLDTNALQMRVMNVVQYDSLLFVSLGSHFFTSTDPPGVAIVDVSNPASPVVKDIWIHSSPGNGCGIVKVEGNYAYVGGMGLGLIILNISDINNIQFVSLLPLDINYPVPNPNNPEWFNVRGMEVRNDIAYVCFDAGGLRIINCADKLNPVETGRYANPITYPGGNEMARAYNNIILRDSLAYIAVDYCGLEIIDIGDTSNLNLVHHWNPHGCPWPGLWWEAPLHSNELKYIPGCEKLFISSGKSEMIVLDVTNPVLPDSCAVYGNLNDTTGTWGIGVKDDKIYLTYTYVPTWVPLMPFYSTWSGIRMITWDNSCANGVETYEDKEKEEIAVYPNPGSGQFTVVCPVLKNKPVFVYITDISGKTIFYDQQTVSGDGKITTGKSNLLPGSYFVSVTSGNCVYHAKIMVVNR